MRTLVRLFSAQQSVNLTFTCVRMKVGFFWGGGGGVICLFIVCELDAHQG